MKRNEVVANLDRNNRRGKKERSASKIVIYTEGELTEPKYLNDWISIYANKNDILPAKAKNFFKIEKGNSDSEPLQVVERLIEQENPTRNKAEDLFFVVFDDDDRSQSGGLTKQNFDLAWEKAQSNNIGVIYSNRSIEFWALLHFCNDRPVDKTALEAKLKRFMSQYDAQSNKVFDVNLMLEGDNEEQAIARAKKIRASNKKEGDCYARPCTNADELIEAMKKRLSDI